LLGPVAGAALVVIMKSVMSAYIERWNFTLGAIFVLIVLFMPEGLVPGSRRFLRFIRASAKARRPPAPAESGG
jgi:branched-chain amino acid transport system permease protein